MEKPSAGGKPARIPPPWRPDFAAASPASHHVANLAARLAGEDWPTLDRLDQLARERDTRNAAGLPIRFSAQHVRCGQRDYETAILETGMAPTRERNWHDLFNALTWLTFPRAKAALNAIQCEARRDASGQRGERSDAATLLDESGLVLVSTQADLAALLRRHAWKAAFVQRRADWRATRVYAFGHAILEKLLDPWPGITAKCLFLHAEPPPEGEPPEWLDAALATACRSEALARPERLFPVPVLGVPGWWPDNADAAFYDDERVFRPLRAM